MFLAVECVGPGLALSLGMSKHTHSGKKPATPSSLSATASSLGGKGAVVVVGGSGGLSERYRAIVEGRGMELRHFENRVPNGARHGLGRVAAVIVIVGMVSHALRDQVKGLIPVGAPVVYLRSASISAMRTAVEEIV